jgi:hypothetical protein
VCDLVYKDRKVRVEEATLKAPLDTSSKSEIHQAFTPDGSKPNKHP